jgi:hypothetical protein
MRKFLALIFLVPLFACGEDSTSPVLAPKSPPATSQSMTRSINLDVPTLLNLLLTSGLVSSVASGLLIYNLNGKRERSEFRRTKLEELFMAHEGFCKIIEDRFRPFILEIKERPDRIAKHKEDFSKFKEDFSKYREDMKALPPNAVRFLSGTGSWAVLDPASMTTSTYPTPPRNPSWPTFSQQDSSFASKDKDIEQEQTQKCEMIILLYLKEFLLNWNKLKDCREQIISLKSGCIKASEATLDDDCQSFLQPFEDAMKNFENEKRIMKDVMIEKARKLTP